MILRWCECGCSEIIHAQKAIDIEQGQINFPCDDCNDCYNFKENEE